MHTHFQLNLNGKIFKFLSFFFSFCGCIYCATYEYVADFVYEYVQCLHCELWVCIHEYARSHHIACTILTLTCMYIPNRALFSKRSTHCKKVKVLTFIYGDFKNAIFNQIDLTVKKSTFGLACFSKCFNLLQHIK